jgi:outer membrane protein
VFGLFVQASTGTTASYQLSKHWGLIGLVRGGTYLGDAADSPIVKDGSKTFGLAALGVSYSF